MSCNLSEMKKGDKLSEIQYYTVKDFDMSRFGTMIIVTNERGEEMQIAKDIIENGCTCASQYDSVEKVTKSELAEIFRKASRIVVTVCYNKQVKIADLLKKDVIESLYPETRLGETKAAFTKRVKGILKERTTGEERVMVGRHYGFVDVNGRIPFIDMEQPITEIKDGYDTRQRLVDPRTIKYAIIDNVRYEVK